MRKANLILLALFIVNLALTSCDYEYLSTLDKPHKVLNLPEIPASYNVGVSDEIPTLGRVLFYDKRLSSNNKISCYSCHNQALGFADNKKFSFGVNGQTLRNSMPIQNIVSNVFTGQVFFDSLGHQVNKNTSLFWDGRQKDLKKMVLMPIQNHIEMGVNDIENVVQEISKIDIYKILFEQAFGPNNINSENLATALSAFVLSIRTDNSKFDRSLTGAETLNSTEQQGQALFFDIYNCNSCHNLQQPFNGYQNAGVGSFGGFADIGLDSNPTDVGVFSVSGDQADVGKFKVPSLRNIELTAPYMHDGRFETLDDVLNHYSEKIEASANLDDRLKENGQPKKFNISLNDKQAIIAFLKTLTDSGIISDKRFSDPFVRN